MTTARSNAIQTTRTPGTKQGGRSPEPGLLKPARRRRDPCSRIGETYGSLTILSVFSSLESERHIKYVVCRCVCGKEKITAANYVIWKNVRSCGCSRIKHGATIGGKPTLTYMIWSMTRNACAGRGVDSRGSVGAAGFTMHEPWVESFASFLHDMGEAPPGHRLFRHDTAEHFIPGNCYWGPKAPRKAAPPQFRGMVAGRLTVLEPIDGDDATATLWRARCECGNDTEVLTSSLKQRSRQSCGCLAIEHRFRTHGATTGKRPTKAYRTWSALRQRLVVKMLEQPEIVRRRAAKFDSRWATFEGFFDDLGDAPDEAYLLVRIDDAAGYVHGNCVWYPKERMIQVNGGWAAKDRQDLLAVAKAAGLAAA